jgi:hypothetical protein
MGVYRLPRERLSGIWTPTLTIVSNLAVLTLVKGMFGISGGLVTCWLSATADPTAASVYTFRASLPIGLDVVDVDDLIGVAIGDSIVGVGDVTGVIATDDALVTVDTGADTLHDVRATFAYRIP